jgi:hypothetical protein
MGSLLLFLAILVIVALVVYVADQHLKGQLGVYNWQAFTAEDPAGHRVELTIRSSALASCYALDRLDLSPQVVLIEPGHACVYCRTMLAHTRAACIATFDTYGRPELEAWRATVAERRALLTVCLAQTGIGAWS